PAIVDEAAGVLAAGGNRALEHGLGADRIMVAIHQHEREAVIGRAVVRIEEPGLVEAPYRPRDVVGEKLSEPFAGGTDRDGGPRRTGLHHAIDELLVSLKLWRCPC